VHEVCAKPVSDGSVRCRGQLDLVQRDLIEGWAQDQTQPDVAVELRILDNGVPIGEVRADGYREDLLRAGVGDGRHSFSLSVPGGLAPECRHLIEVRRVTDGAALEGSPIILEPQSAAVTTLRSALAPQWRGHLDTVLRERIEGWAWDPRAPARRLALVLLDNGAAFARVLANRYRPDLEQSAVGDGRHGFAVRIPGGLSPLTRHVIQVLGEADGCELPGSPAAIEPASGFDAALEYAVSSAVSALATPADRERALTFLTAQTERVLQLTADAEASREARLLRREWEHRWGRGARTTNGADPEPAAHRRALVVDEQWPAASPHPRSVALLSHLRALKSLGYEVSFAMAGAMAADAATRTLLDAEAIKACVAPYYAAVEDVLRRQRDGFDLIYLNGLSSAAKYLALARVYNARARIIYSLAELEHVRVARRAQVEQRPELLIQGRRLRWVDLAAAATADAVVTGSRAAAAWLRRTVPGANVHVVPWVEQPRPISRSWTERSGVALIGDFGESAYADAARWLLEDIMPLVWRQEPSIECLIVGDGVPESVARLVRPGVTVLGSGADPARVLDRVRLTVAPLRYGAGPKVPVLASLAAGVPCVTSSVAAEGLGLPPELGGASGADAAAIAGHILRLHADPAAYQTVAQASVQFVSARYREADVAASLGAAIDGRRALDLPTVPSAPARTRDEPGG
jgi:glycosyltransferase involved in cell wall biosynthesis